MCGIFGIFSNQVSINFIGELKKLANLSESRGKEASGLAIVNKQFIKIIKIPFKVSLLTQSKLFDREVFNYQQSNPYFYVMGHARLVTNGYETNNSNNQPVFNNGIVTIHNGIIVNEEKLWMEFDLSNKQTDLDSELIPVILSNQKKINKNIKQTIHYLFNKIEGMTSFASVFSDTNQLLLASNNGSLYYILDIKSKILIFASEFTILKEFLRKTSLEISDQTIHHIFSNDYIFINLSDLSNAEEFLLEESLKEIQEIQTEEFNTSNLYNKSLGKISYTPDKKYYKEFEINQGKIKSLIRCKKCLLPETFSYLQFDANGICNYCHGYKNIEHKAIETLKSELPNYLRNSRKVLVPFSGGRDSSYALHIIKNILSLDPVTFTYDWGMVADLARRNQSRLCGKLGIEHILVSADIRKKRLNIKKNVVAWLKRPKLGTIPLFMAGDKQYFYHSNRILKELGISLSILGENKLETTYFKSGFCNIKPNFSESNTYSLGLSNKFKMLSFYTKEMILNPSYFNTSLVDTLDAFKSYYVLDHKVVNLYNYLKWDEKEIEKTLISEYDWELSPDTKSTWRIGDGTASFYNYIYYTVAGFSEFDTFRSNQIREGMINREEALQLIHEENKPRFESIKWYLDTIGLDFDNTINTINKIPKLYQFI